MEFDLQRCERDNITDMRYTGPRNRLARREGIDLGLKGVGSKAYASLMRRINIKPGQRPNSRYGKLTEYGTQLREKQKIRRMYGLTESQLQRYFQDASRKVGNTGELLVGQLEARLDNVVYRLGFAPTRPSARQLVNHGHFYLNKEKASVPSIHVNIGDVISFKKDDSTKIPYIQDSIEKKDVTIPSWLDRKATIGKVVQNPGLDALVGDINLQAVIEFYSR